MHEAMPAFYTREYVRQVQMALNEKTKMSLNTTGNFNAGWVEVLKGYQIQLGLLPTGKYDGDVKDDLELFIQKKYLQDNDYEEVAEVLGCSKETVQALVATVVERGGFISSGRCRITFNREKFHRELCKQYSQSIVTELCLRYPAIVNVCGGGYLNDDFEYERFGSAVSIDSYAAMMSTTWGMFRIPGGNYRLCGYSKITEFAFAMQHSERKQIHAWAVFLKNNKKAVKALREKKWEDFCREYFGEAYKLYEYDARMARHYRHFAKKRKVEAPA